MVWSGGGLGVSQRRRFRRSSHSPCWPPRRGPGAARRSTPNGPGASCRETCLVARRRLRYNGRGTAAPGPGLARARAAVGTAGPGSRPRPRPRGGAVRRTRYPDSLRAPVLWLRPSRSLAACQSDRALGGPGCAVATRARLSPGWWLRGLLMSFPGQRRGPPLGSRLSGRVTNGPCSALAVMHSRVDARLSASRRTRTMT